MHDEPTCEKSGVHKRTREESPNDLTRPTSKKRRRRSTDGYSPDFWDTLSVVHLTRRALREFDRRLCYEEVQPVNKRATVPLRRLLRSDLRCIRELAGNGGLNVNHLRGYAEDSARPATMSQSSRSNQKRSFASTTQDSRSIKRSSAYSKDFQQKLIDCGVYPEGYTRTSGVSPPEPENIEEVQERLAKSRASLSPSSFSKSAFEDFKNQNRFAPSEASAMTHVVTTIAGSKDTEYRPAPDILFNNVAKFDDTLVTPRPDIYYGARPEQIDRPIRHDLHDYIHPSTRTDLPTLPTFFLEGKSASGSSNVAQRQAMYDGAIGARGIYQLQNYGQRRRDPDGNAYTLSATYVGETMKIYAHYPRRSEVRPGRIDYHMTQLRAYAMTDSPETFRQGAAAYRNARDWTQEQRNQLINDTNAGARRVSASTSSSSRAPRPKDRSSIPEREEVSTSDTSTDELATAATTVKRQRQSDPR